MTMTTLRATITANQLKAALLFTADSSDVRTNIRGVCIEHGPTGARMIATDGHRMIVARIQDDTDHGAEGATRPAEEVCYVIARETIETLCKATPARDAGNGMAFTWMQVTRPDPERDGVTIVERASIRIDSAIARIPSFTTTDLQDTMGKFPPWQRIVPRVASGVVAQFNAHYIADAAKARGILVGGKKHFGLAAIAHNGDGAALIDLGPDAFGIIMPMRAVAPELPEWFTGPTAVDGKVAA